MIKTIQCIKCWCIYLHTFGAWTMLINILLKAAGEGGGSGGGQRRHAAGHVHNQKLYNKSSEKSWKSLYNCAQFMCVGMFHGPGSCLRLLGREGCLEEGRAGMPLARYRSSSRSASLFTVGVTDLPNSSRQRLLEERRAIGLGGSAAISNAACIRSIILNHVGCRTWQRLLEERRATGLGGSAAISNAACIRSTTSRHIKCSLHSQHDLKSSWLHSMNGLMCRSVCRWKWVRVRVHADITAAVHVHARCGLGCAHGKFSHQGGRGGRHSNMCSCISSTMQATRRHCTLKTQGSCCGAQTIK